MFAVLDFGAGNMASAVHALAEHGEVKLCRDPDEIPADAVAAVLPGDGSFGAAMNALSSSGLADWIRADPRPLLGICVGFQLLFDHSEEDGGVDGLGLIPGRVERFWPGAGKVPHMGWNRATALKSSPLLDGVADREWFYFVHSYRPRLPEGHPDALLGCDYGGPFTAAVERGRLCGFQFHPEKSWRAGRRLLSNWAERCLRGA